MKFYFYLVCGVSSVCLSASACSLTFRCIVLLHFNKNHEMYLRYYLNENGDRHYTLATIDPQGKPTLSAHPARFSPEDKYSRQRITIKKRFGLLITQQPEPIH